MLNLLVLSGGNERSRSDNRAIQGRRRGPSAEPEAANGDDSQTNQARNARALWYGFVPLINSWTSKKHFIPLTQTVETRMCVRTFSSR
jgi:hypothetical protein